MLRRYVRQFCQGLVRKWPLEPREESESRRAPLSTLSLVILGVCRTLEAGVCVLIGVTTLLIAGPAIVISFLVVALSSVLSGLCYAELCAWVPRSGSVYLYSYVTMGELCAFIIGWNRLLYLVAAASCLTRAWSYAFDSLIGNHISQALERTFSPHMPSFLAPYPDFIALGLVLLMTGFTASLLGILDLVKLMSAGVLPAYTLVAVSVLVLRYQPDQNLSKKGKTEKGSETSDLKASPSEPVPEAGPLRILKSLWFPTSTTPTKISGQIVYGCASLLVLLLSTLSLILAQWPSQVFSGDPRLTTVVLLLLLLITGVTVIIWRQPQSPSPLLFRVPALPVLPPVSIFVNIYLMMQITSETWILFGIWMAIGSVIYLGYEIRHSLAGNNHQQPPASTPQNLD